MDNDRKRIRPPWIRTLFAASLAALLGVCPPARGEILRMAGDVSQELDVVSPTPLTFTFEFPDDVVEIVAMRAWATGKQNLGTFVTMDDGVRSEVPGGAGLTITVQAACEGVWEHRSAILPQGTWDYDATFAWNDAGSGCTANLDDLLATPFTMTVLAFPEYQPYDLGWWEPTPGFFLVAVVLEFDVNYAVPAEGMSWSGIKALYD